MSNHANTMEMYDSLGTNEKRAANRLIRGLSAGNVGRSELNKIYLPGRVTGLQWHSK